MTYFISSDDEELKANDFLHIIFKPVFWYKVHHIWNMLE